ncbi:MAG: hypothetical protein AAGJ50_06780, partial [Pseudomonadota bacterium]
METLHLLATMVLGLFAGSLLTEGVILVPYWRRMAPKDFFRLHSELGPSLFRYFAPLTLAAVSSSVVSAFFSADASIWRPVSAMLCLLTLVIFFVYFRK